MSTRLTGGARSDEHTHPFAFWLVDSGRLSFAESITPLQAGLIEKGVAFHEQVESVATPLVEEVDLPTLFAREGLELLNVPGLVNEKLGFRGRPDGVRTESGSLIPIEIKSHRDVLPTDRLELAFYWLLLEPYRTRSASPRGVVILRRDGGEEAVEVPLLPRHFAEVSRVVEEVRRTRLSGVSPRICSCSVCTGPMQGEVLRRVHRDKDLTLITGISARIARELEALGISCYTDLVDCDHAGVVEALRAKGLIVSAEMVQRWCHHVESYERAEAVLFGTRPVLPSSFIALDLEYDGHTWLTGICVVDGPRREFVQLWADTAAAERRNLRQLARIVEDNPSLPVITWGGLGADIPQLRKSGVRLKLTRVVGAIVANHQDLYQYAVAAVRLPVPSLALPEVAAYFGVSKLSELADGFAAQVLYRAYSRAPRGAMRDGLRDELLEYNRDDLLALVAVAEGLRRLASGPGGAVAVPAA